MIPFLLLSSVVTPLFAFLILFWKIDNQEDGRTAMEARRDVLKKLPRSPIVWIWIFWNIILILFINGTLTEFLRWLNELKA